MKYFILFITFYSLNTVAQTFEFTDLLKLVENEEYPFDSFEFLENKGFTLIKSVDFSEEIGLETELGKEKVKGCKMTYYGSENSTVNVHSCPSDKLITMFDFGNKKLVGIMFTGNSKNYNYLIEKINENCILIAKEPFEPNSQVITHTYKHNNKSVYFHFYKYLQKDGMFYVLYVGM